MKKVKIENLKYNIKREERKKTKTQAILKTKTITQHII